VQGRLGQRAARELLASWLSVLDMRWVTPEIHDAAVAALIAGPRRSVSLVDLVSFEVMRRQGIRTAFTFDRDFERAGFRTVP
jgi:predicted nucleic acid-binding protein